MMSYERKNIAAMSGYVPGEQPDTPDVVKLNTNENPYPPTEAVMAALRGIESDALRRYPNPTAEPFRNVAAQAHGLDPANVVATNGGDELLRLAITTFVEPGSPIGTAEPSYSLYPVLADVHGSPVHRTPLNEDWSLPDDFAAQMNNAAAQLVFIVNPHAPSGSLRSVEQLAAIAEQLDGVLLIDEAYVNFVDPSLNHDTTKLVREMDNVLILRTLSKGYSLAGLRFGYGLGPASLIEPMLTKTRDSYNTDAVAQALATAALGARDEAAKTWAAVRDERDRLSAALREMGLTVPDSQSNFVLAAVPEKIAGGARSLYELLKAKKIYVRYFDQDRLRDKLRITIGTPDQNNALLNALKAMN